MSAKLRVIFLFIGLYFLVATNSANLISSMFGSSESFSNTKIVLHGDLLVIKPSYAKIHLYNVRNPDEPVFVSLIPIIGGQDVSVKGDFLYSDGYKIEDPNDYGGWTGGLHIYTISDPAKPTFVRSLPNILLPRFPHTWNDSSWSGCACDDEPKYYDDAYGPSPGGSTAAFTIVGNYLYAIRHNTLIVLDVSDGANPHIVQKVHLTTVGETIYPYDSTHLLLGGRTGMTIYDISDPRNPAQVSTSFHATACDPVVGWENRAYVTLRTGNTCGGIFNQLDIIDITDLSSPVLLTSFPLTRPFGLACDGKYVYVCDGPAGLRQLNVEDESAIFQVSRIADFVPQDIIKREDILYVTSNQYISLFRMVDETTPVLLSIIQIKSWNGQP